MSLTTADKIFLCVGLIDIGGLLVWLGVALRCILPTRKWT